MSMTQIVKVSVDLPGASKMYRAISPSFDHEPVNQLTIHLIEQAMHNIENIADVRGFATEDMIADYCRLVGMAATCRITLMSNRK